MKSTWILATCALGAISSAQAVRYRIEPITVPGGYRLESIGGMNSEGQIAGSVFDLNQNRLRPCTFRPALNLLADPPTGVFGAVADDIADDRRILGRYLDSTGKPTYAQYNSITGWSALPVVGNNPRALSMNRAGETVGIINDRVACWSRTGELEVTPAKIGHSGVTFAVIGTHGIAGGAPRNKGIELFRSHWGVWSDLQVPIGTEFSMRDMGPDGTVVGTVDQRAGCWGPDGTFAWLGDGLSKSEATGINGTGVIIGAQNDQVALWFATGSLMLNSVLDGSGSGWSPQSALGINDAGMIHGFGWHNGVWKPYRAIPRPGVTGGVVLRDYSASPGTQRVWVELWRESDGAFVGRFLQTLSASGFLNAPVAAPDGSYSVRVWGSHWLTRQYSATMSNERLVLSASLINGDVDGDNEVGPSDFGAMSAAWGSTTRSLTWNANADLNGDGRVGSLDYEILERNFGLAGD